MGRILRPIAGFVLFVFAAVWIAAVSISTLEGVITIPASATPTQQAILGALRWLAGTNPASAYFFAALLLLLGFGVLFWHPEKGWAFYFEKPEKPAHKITPPSLPTIRPQAPLTQTIPAQPSPRNVLSDEEREFTENSPKELMQIFNSHNSLQAKKLFEPYIGVWIHVEGEARLISEFTDYFSVYLATADAISGVDVQCRGIKKSEASRLMRLGKNERIAIIGRIKECSTSWLEIEDCEIIATNLPASPPPTPAPQ